MKIVLCVVLHNQYNLEPITKNKNRKKNIMKENEKYKENFLPLLAIMGQGYTWPL